MGKIYWCEAERMIRTWSGIGGDVVELLVYADDLIDSIIGHLVKVGDQYVVEVSVMEDGVDRNVVTCKCSNREDAKRVAEAWCDSHWNDVLRGLDLYE